MNGVQGPYGGPFSGRFSTPFGGPWAGAYRGAGIVPFFGPYVGPVGFGAVGRNGFDLNTSAESRRSFRERSSRARDVIEHNERQAIEAQKQIIKAERAAAKNGYSGQDSQPTKGKGKGNGKAKGKGKGKGKGKKRPSAQL